MLSRFLQCPHQWAKTITVQSFSSRYFLSASLSPSKFVETWAIDPGATALCIAEARDVRPAVVRRAPDGQARTITTLAIARSVHMRACFPTRFPSRSATG